MKLIRLLRHIKQNFQEINCMAVYKLVVKFGEALDWNFRSYYFLGNFGNQGIMASISILKTSLNFLTP